MVGCTPKAVPMPEDRRSEWRVGFTTFAEDGLSVENLYLAYSLPQLLLERLDGIDRHAFDEPGKNAYRRTLQRKELQTAAEDLAKLHQQRDQLIFKGLESPSRAAQYRDLEEKISRIKQRIQSIRTVDPTSIPFPDEKPVRYVYSTDSGRLLEAPLFSPLQFSRTADLDLLILGRVEEIEGFLFLRVSAFETALESEVYVYEDAATRSDLYFVLDELSEALANVLLGEPAATLVIHPDPLDAAIMIDDEFVGTGLTTLPFLRPRATEVRITRPGYFDTTEIIELEPSQTLSLNVSLLEVPVEMVRLSSIPQDADVYQNSVWIGKTPIRVSRPSHLEQIRLVKEGYHEGRLHVSPVTSSEVTVSLVAATFEFEERQEALRDRFYRSFGRFIVSLGAPMALISVANNTLQMDVSIGGSDPSVRFRRDVAVWSSYTGAIISITFFSVMVADLLEYVRAADRSAG